MGFLTRSPLQIFSSTFKASGDLLHFANLGYKYCPASTPDEVLKNTNRVLAITIPALQLKVSRVLTLNAGDRCPKPLRGPPSNWTPAINWDDFPEWQAYFRYLRAEFWADFRAAKTLTMTEPNYVRKGAKRKIWLTNCVKEVHSANHLFGRADKDPSMLIVDRDLYFRAESHLLETLKVRKIGLNASKVVADCCHFMNAAVLDLIRSNSVPTMVARWLEEGLKFMEIPKLKLLFKTHKPLDKWWLGGLVPPARPIVTQHSWLTKCCGHILTQYLGALLQWVRKDHPFCLLQNSFELIRHLEKGGYMGRGDLRIATADFDSLYSNLPMKLVVEAVHFFAAKYETKVDGLDALSSYNVHAQIFFAAFLPPKFLPEFPCEVRSSLDALLRLVLTLNVFVSGAGETWAQTDGIAMGLGCAPILADLALAYLEVGKPDIFRNLAVARYLDDMVVLGVEQDVIVAINQITSLYPLLLSWTPLQCEVSYLDTFIACKVNGLEIGVFFKPQNNAVYIPYCSEHIFSQKTSWLRGELIRYIRICSSELQFNVARTRFVLAATARGYPQKLLQRTLDMVRWADRAKFLVVRARETELRVGFRTHTHIFRSHNLPDSPGNLVVASRAPPESVDQVITRSQNMLLHRPLLRRLD